MAKIKPLDQLAQDARKGDLFRLICVNFPDQVGFYQTTAQKSNTQKQNIAVFSGGQRLVPGRGNRIFYVNLSSGELCDEIASYDCPLVDEGQPRVTYYEIIRRFKFP